MNFIYLVSCIGITYAVSIPNLDSLYWTYDEIGQQLDDWKQDFGLTPYDGEYYENTIIYHLDTIGFSSNDTLPIYAVKISDNADMEEKEESKVLILGQCHAEEIYGVQMSMRLIEWLLHPENTSWINDLKTFMKNLEIWIVPTHNPEGLNVVHGFEDGENFIQDISFRKNKTDVNENEEFDYVSFNPDGIAGLDLDGVDLNRNYGLNWFLGDDKHIINPQSCPSNQNYSSDFDYYRGSEPFSETEIQAIRDFVIDKKFLVSVAYHSSRSGCVSERVIFPWGWKDHTLDLAKVSPDYTIIEDLAEGIASNIEKQGSSLSYITGAQKSRTGNAHDWIYSETGCYQFLIEMGNSEIQIMDQQMIDNVIENNRKGLFYLLSEAAGGGEDLRQIKGYVIDQVTGDSLSGVEFRVEQLYSSVLKPRLTDLYGGYHRILGSGYYDIIFIKEGYEIHIKENISVFSGRVKKINIELIPLTTSEVTFTINNYNENMGEVQLMLKDVNHFSQKYEISNQPLSIQLYNQEYTLLLTGNFIAPFTSKISVESIETIDLTIDSKVPISEDFVDMEGWVSSDTWQKYDGKIISQNYYDSGPIHENQKYPHDSDGIIKLNNAFIIEEDQVVAVEIHLAYELEWDKDTAYFNIFSDQDYIQIAEWTNQNWSVHPEYYFFNAKGGKTYGLEFGISSDETISYRGLEIHDLYFYHSSSILDNVEISLPYTFRLNQNYPNPFNPTTVIKFYLPVSDRVSLRIYDIKGREIESILYDKFLHAGLHKYTYKINDMHLSSGLYIYKIATSQFIDSKKMLILK